MKKIYSAVLLSLALFFAVVNFSWAATYNFSPTPSNLSGLDHYYNYTWGLDWNVPDGEEVMSASLFFNDIRNYNDTANVLYVHLLDFASVGVVASWDNQGGGDNFVGQGLKLFEWHDLSSTATDLTYTFTGSDLGMLATYLADGKLGFGFDPDCHFYNNGITFTVETAPVPIPGAVWLLGSGLLGLVGIRRKKG